MHYLRPGKLAQCLSPSPFLIRLKPALSSLFTRALQQRYLTLARCSRYPIGHTVPTCTTTTWFSELLYKRAILGEQVSTIFRIKEGAEWEITCGAPVRYHGRCTAQTFFSHYPTGWHDKHSYLECARQAPSQRRIFSSTMGRATHLLSCRNVIYLLQAVQCVPPWTTVQAVQPATTNE